MCVVVVVLCSCLFVCYGVNAFPVCDCVLDVPYLRRSPRFCEMLFVYVIMVWLVLVVCVSMPLVCFV